MKYVLKVVSGKTKNHLFKIIWDIRKHILKKRDDTSGLLLLIIFVGAFVLLARLLHHTDSFHTGLLYIAQPFTLSLAIYYFTSHTDGTTWLKHFWNNLRTFLIVILASSIILMEGYVCVIMAIPLFVLIFIIMFITMYIASKLGKKSPKSYILPGIVILASLEGTTPEFTFNRYNRVSYTQTVDIDVKTVKQRLTNPLQFQGDRHWILSIFPMPVYVGTVKLNEGDIRKYDFIYHRWFVTNTKVGSIDVLFQKVDQHKIRTKITDTSYISGYMELHGTEFTFEPVNDHQTKVTLSVSFDRKLDPIWYYGPLERFAVKKGIQYFINETLNKTDGDSHDI